MSAPREISVIVPSHQAEATIGECLAGLSSQSLEPDRFDVHIVDSGLDDASAVVASHAAAWDGRLHLHRADAELGPAAKRNLGARASGSPLLAFTDADCRPDPRWLEALAAAAERADLVQGPTLPPPGSNRGPFDHAINVAGPSPLFESCNIAYRRAAFERAGGFPTGTFERTGEVFGEDAELAWRAIRNGARTAFAPAAVVRHAVIKVPFREHLRDQWRARHFPRLVRELPELRRELLTARLFLGRRSLTYDAAAAGLAAIPLTPWTAALAAPYAVHLARAVRHRGPRGISAGVARRLVSDTVRAAALVSGSLRYRTPVL